MFTKRKEEGGSGETGKQKEDRDNTVFRAKDQDDFQEELVITSKMVTEKKAVSVDQGVLGGALEYSLICVVVRRDMSEAEYTEEEV